MNTSVDRAIMNGTAFRIKTEQCESLDGQIKSTSKNYDRLAQVVTLEGAEPPGSDSTSDERTFFMIGLDAELNATSAGWNNEVYISPGGKTEIFILPANHKIKANRRVALIIYE
jgi:hypothetical protein|tara:strand:+ start:442 stop:783 length:342 start_codon:yes stop_codon:yes gene_type:complete